MSAALGILLGLLVAVGLGGYLYLRNRPGESEPIYHFNCPSCGQRLRYKAKQRGRQGMCPRCRNPLTFPAATPD